MYDALPNNECTYLVCHLVSSDRQGQLTDLIFVMLVTAATAPAASQLPAATSHWLPARRGCWFRLLKSAWKGKADCRMADNLSV